MFNKGQAATELMVLIAFMMMTFLAYFGAIESKAIDISKNADNQLLQQVGEVIKSNLDIAATVENGFRHRITIPSNILTKEYETTLCPLYKTYISYEVNEQGTCLGGRKVTYPEVILKYKDIPGEISIKISNQVVGEENAFQNAIDSDQEICLSKENNVVYVNSPIYTC